MLAPSRPGYGTMGFHTSVLTNFTPLFTSPNTIVYQHDVSFTPVLRLADSRRKIMQVCVGPLLVPN